MMVEHTHFLKLDPLEPYPVGKSLPGKSLPRRNRRSQPDERSG
jgi:hypothetical protein